MSYKTQTGNSIDDAFAKFHRENPHLYRLIENRIFSETKNAKKTSVKKICNDLRWDPTLSTNGANDGFKLNDAFISRYARLFCDMNPLHAHLIEVRRLRPNIPIHMGVGQ